MLHMRVGAYPVLAPMSGSSELSVGDRLLVGGRVKVKVLDDEWTSAPPSSRISGGVSPYPLLYVAASSKTRPVTAGAGVIPSTWSAIFCAPHDPGSPHPTRMLP